MDVRCSSLPLLARCAAAAVPPALKVEGDDGAARLGTAVHAWLADRIRSGIHVDPAELPKAYPGLDADECAALAWSAWKCWEAVAHYFPTPQTERELRYEDGLGTITGHPDVLSIYNGAVWIADHKTGFLDENHDEQMKGYGWLGVNAFHVDVANVCLIRVRGGTADWARYTRPELAAWWDAFTDRLTAERETYRPGTHCRYCRRFLECPAAGRLLEKAENDLLTLQANLDLPRDSELGTLLDFCKILEDRCQLARNLVRARVAQAGGRLATGDGRELILVQQERREIAFDPGMGIIADEGLITTKLKESIRIPKGVVEDEVRASAARGLKKAAVEKLTARLEEAGAIRTSVIERLEVRRSVKQVENADDNIIPTSVSIRPTS